MTQQIETKQMKQNQQQDETKVIPYSQIKFMAVTLVDEKGADGKLTGNKTRKLKLQVEVDGSTKEGQDIRNWISSVNDKRIVDTLKDPVTGKKSIIANDGYRLSFYYNLGLDGKPSVTALGEDNIAYDSLPRFDTRDGDTGLARFSITLSTASNGSKFFKAGKFIQLKNMNINANGEHKTAKSSSKGLTEDALLALIEAEERGSN